MLQKKRTLQKQEAIPALKHRYILGITYSSIFGGGRQSAREPNSAIILSVDTPR
jgi:hypothetical protein